MDGAVADGSEKSGGLATHQKRKSNESDGIMFDVKLRAPGRWKHQYVTSSLRNFLN